MSEEKKIPHFVNDPVINKLTAPENKLYRPQIHFGRAFGVVVLAIVATMLISYGLLYLLERSNWITFENSSQLQKWLSVYWKVQLLVLQLTLRYIFIWFIRVYQRYAKSETRLRCCYIPSCSEYAILALKKYGLFIGCYKAVNRLLRCGPPGGIDYP
jgi:putative membrane protein insertion efficiency factor